MTTADYERFSEVLQGIAQVKGRRLLDDHGLAEYFEAVRHLTFEQFRYGIRAAARDSRYLPDPAEVIDRAPVVASPGDDPFSDCPDCKGRGYVLAERYSERLKYSYTVRAACSCQDGRQEAVYAAQWRDRMIAEGRTGAYSWRCLPNHDGESKCCPQWRGKP